MSLSPAIAMPTPSVELSPPVASPPSNEAPTPTPQENPRRSRVLSPSDTASKRFSTASNPAREAPSPVIKASSSNNLTSTRQHKIPSFPPPQASRISMVSLSSNRDSFHPQFASSLPYASVRDFAYPSIHPLHYGSVMTSGLTTPASSQRESGYMESGSGGWFATGGSGYRRLSDPAVLSVETGWGDRRRFTNQPPPLNFEDGPPWSEDDDLQSPVVLPKSANAWKHKSSASQMQSHHRGMTKSMYLSLPREHFQGDEKDWEVQRRAALENGLEPGGSYYTTGAGKRDLAEGEPGGELYNHQEQDEYGHQYFHNPDYIYSDDEGREYDPDDPDYNSRFSRDYQFTIASPEEEMHGTAVALFDFVQENENELPLVEGQVVWISFRHGMGWLVAEDPMTRESGLVPEEYVRLLRDIQGEQQQQQQQQVSEMNPSALMPESASDHNDPTSAEEPSPRLPVISTFSTSSQDLQPYPHHLRSESTQPDISPVVSRVEQIRQEQDQAVAEEHDVTPRLKSDAFNLQVKANGDMDKEREHALSPMSAEQEFFDAPESQLSVEFREKEADKKVEPKPDQPKTMTVEVRPDPKEKKVEVKPDQKEEKKPEKKVDATKKEEEKVEPTKKEGKKVETTKEEKKVETKKKEEKKKAGVKPTPEKKKTKTKKK